MNLGENIYKYRTQKRMSQGDLADALDVSRQSVSKWENNNAVPELDKLIKMSDLFGISLDELVSGEEKAQPVKEDSPSLPRPHIPTRKLAGFLLLVCAFLTFLVPTALGGLATGVALCIPFVLCGACCFLFPRHTAIWCAWALYLPFSFIPIDQYIRMDVSLMVHLFTKLPLLICTVLAFRKEKLELTPRLRFLLGVGYIAWFLYFCMLLGTWSSPRVFYEGIDLKQMLDIISFPLFTAVLTTTIRLLKSK